MNPTGGEFLDTNVLVYAFSTDPRTKAAEQLLAKGCLVSLQGLNEFTNVARRKLGMEWNEIRDALGSIRVLCPQSCRWMPKRKPTGWLSPSATVLRSTTR